MALTIFAFEFPVGSAVLSLRHARRLYDGPRRSHGASKTGPGRNSGCCVVIAPRRTTLRRPETVPRFLQDGAWPLTAKTKRRRGVLWSPSFLWVLWSCVCFGGPSQEMRVTRNLQDVNIRWFLCDHAPADSPPHAHALLHTYSHKHADKDKRHVLPTCPVRLESLTRQGSTGPEWCGGL